MSQLSLLEKDETPHYWLTLDVPDPIWALLIITLCVIILWLLTKTIIDCRRVGSSTAPIDCCKKFYDFDLCCHKRIVLQDTRTGRDVETG